MSKYEYKCMTCDHIYWFDHGQTYKNCTKCEDRGELRLKSIQHDDFKPEDKNSVYDDGAGNVDYPEIDITEDDKLKHSLSGIEGGHQFIPDLEKKDEEPEMPEGGWECSECGASVDNMNDVCSRSCFNAMMR